MFQGCIFFQDLKLRTITVCLVSLAAVFRLSRNAPPHKQLLTFEQHSIWCKRFGTAVVIGRLSHADFSAQEAALSYRRHRLMDGGFCHFLFDSGLFSHHWKDLMQYLLLILQTYCHFSGRVWLAYNQAFHKHAAATRLLVFSSSTSM